MRKNSVCRNPYLRNHTSSDFDLWYSCVKQYLQDFFHFFKIFWVARRVKGQKIAQNDKKLCLLHLISQEPYIIWSSFVVHNCKMKSPSIFFYFFKILIFWVVRKVKGQKIAHDDKELCPLHFISQEPYIWSWLMVHMCKMIYLQVLFTFFPNFNFWGK